MPHTQLRRLEEGTFCPVAWRCVGRMFKASSVVSTVPGDMASWGVLWRLPNSKADAHLPETQSFSCEFFFPCLRLCSTGHQFWKTHTSFFCKQVWWCPVAKSKCREQSWGDGSGCKALASHTCRSELKAQHSMKSALRGDGHLQSQPWEDRDGWVPGACWSVSLT